MGKIKRKCDNCGKEYTADTRNLKRGWGGCVAAKVVLPKREKEANPDITQNVLQKTTLSVFYGVCHILTRTEKGIF